MQELKVIGIESGSLLVASDEGAKYRVAIDEVLTARLRQSSPDTGTGRKLSPREIQSQIRAGMSAEDVAAITGASLEYVQRFEGPVLAEREYVIESALNVPVHVAVDPDPLGGAATFGTVIRKRLSDAGALGERWASWKEEGGSWVVKLTFVAELVEHDARWGFDPKKQTLAPLNQEAILLSQQGELPSTLIPRLRAVPADERPESSRFDSGAFEVTDAHAVPFPADLPVLAPVVPGRAAAEAPARGNQTADLLEALRRRRGERDPMDPEHEDPLADSTSTSTGTVRLLDIPLDLPDEEPIGSAHTPSAGLSRQQQETQPNPRLPHGTGSFGPGSVNGTGSPNSTGSFGTTGSMNGTGPLGRKRGRAQMPSWDEIVFGARGDDDL